jgi:hypothetical protein
MSDARRSRSRAVIAFVAVVASIGAAFGACTSYERANGEACIKDIDCLSGSCVAQVCGNSPPPLSGSSYDDGGSVGVDSGTPVEASSTQGTDSATPDSSSGEDAGSDGPAAQVDANNDTGIDANTDDSATGPDATNDATTNDASRDASEMDASDSSDAAPSFDANPDAADAQDAFNQMSRRSFVV